MRIYLSPSDQYANPVAAPVGGSELDWARKAADQAAALLRTIPGVEVKVGADWTPRLDEYARRVEDSNAWGADLHVCFHSNAGQGGTMVCTYPGADSRRLGAAILREVAPLTPSADPGLVDRDDLYELNGTDAVAVLIELDRHDTPDGAAVIKRLVEDGTYAAAVVRGICSYAGLPAPTTAAAGGAPTGGMMTPSQLVELLKGVTYGAQGTMVARIERTFQAAESWLKGGSNDARLAKIEADLAAIKAKVGA